MELTVQPREEAHLQDPDVYSAARHQVNMARPLSIRAKLLLILLGLFTFVAGAFAAYARTSSTRYRELRTLEMSQTVAFESERVARIIAEMDRNVIDLALAGQRYFEIGELSTDTGAAVVVGNIDAFAAAAGGGIWYHPYAFSDQINRVAFYAYRDRNTNVVRYDPSFTTAAYDYPSQMWYRTITQALSSPELTQAARIHPLTAWTVPYHDDAGSHALMTTVGAGIYDDSRLLVGLSTVNWEIESMVRRLAAIQPTEGSFVLLAAPAANRVIINTSTNALSGGALNNVDWAGSLSTDSSEDVRRDSVSIDGREYLTFSKNFDNGWLFSVQIPEDEMFSDIVASNLHYSFALGTALVCGLATAWVLMSRLVSRPLHSLSEQVVELGSAGELNTEIPVKSRDEIGKLAAAFNRMTVDLRASINQRVTAIAEKERIGTELSVAHDIQSAILPHTFPAFPEREEFDIYACMYPQREIGGDFYDFFMVNESTLAIVIADVSGKGVPAALFMMGARTLIRNTVLTGAPPAEALEAVNNALCEGNDSAMFVTAFLGCLDLETGVVSFANAGHNRPILIRGADAETARQDVTWLNVSAGFVLGGLSGLAYPRGEVKLRPGDALLLYTDGVTEAMNTAQEFYGDDRLLAAVKTTCVTDVGKQCELIRDDVANFVAAAQPTDDLTMLLVRYDGPSHAPADTDQLGAVPDLFTDPLADDEHPQDVCAQQQGEI